MNMSMAILAMVDGGSTITAMLYDNTTACDFASLLPLSLILDDYAGIEKISDLPRQLSMRGSPDGCEPTKGDIAYYAPWGNLAIFREGFQYSPGLIKLGRIEEGLEELDRPGPLQVTLERILPEPQKDSHVFS